MRYWLGLAALFGLATIGSSGANGGDKLATATTGAPLVCPQECPECKEPVCQETVMDQCGCCPVCLRQLGDECGPEAGVCASHLRCTQLDLNQEKGVCTEMYPSRCLKAECSVVFHPDCPSDSRLVILPPPPGQCCGTPGKCHCDLQKCAANVPTCDGDMERYLIEKGGSEPGKCCDKFECRKKDIHCESAGRCPYEPLDEDGGTGECPTDSIRPATHVPDGLCCPVRPACRCRASVCRPAVCPEGKRLKILEKGTGTPGNCCDEWKCEDDPQPMTKSCVRDGKTFSDGEEWHSSSCEICRCKKGIAVCSQMSCPQTPRLCTWIVVPDSECCPVCVGCQTENREKFKKNETWQKDDCTTCTCSEEGAPVCEKHMCRTECENPRKVEGQCCPVCDEPTVLTLPSTCPSLEHCPLRCENGLRKDARGCFECDCLPVSHPADTQCPQLSSDNCDKQCAHGYMKDHDGCVVCRCAKCPPLHQCLKTCLYGFESNTVGCPVCKCRSMSRIDAKLTMTEKMGRIAGWDKCISLSSSGKVVERDGGEWWHDGCRDCFCEQKQEFCSLISCPAKPDSCPDEDWAQKDGQCCPVCKSSPTTITAKHEHTVCQSPGTGRLFADGETWQLAPCVSCTCRVGHVLCRTVECPPIACKEPEVGNNDQCCPKCPSNGTVSTEMGDHANICTDETGTAHVAGSSWRTDDCTSCTCTEDARVQCYRESCEETNCKGSPLVIKGKCCAVCSDALSTSSMCAYKSAVYSLGEEWKDGPCLNCTCHTGGSTMCKQSICPPCADAVPIEGQCCPLCKDFGWASLGEGSGSMAPQPTREGPSALPLMGLCLMTVAIIGLLFVLLILYKRSHNASKREKSLGKEAAAVRLSASKHIGSMPQLGDWTQHRRDSQSDGQSESLLSTASDTSTAVSSASSGTGPHPDTLPLTGRRDSKKFCNV